MYYNSRKRPQKPAHKVLNQQQLKLARVVTLVADDSLDFEELSIEQAVEQYRSISYKTEARFPQETLYLESIENGKTLYHEIISAELNDFERYTLQVARWGSVWKLSLDASAVVLRLNTAAAAGV